MNTSAIVENLKLIYLAAKVRLGFLIMACTLAGIAVSPTSSLSSLDIFLVSFAVFICSSTAVSFNQWYERDIDAVMSRTKNRPFVTRDLEPKTVWNYWLLILSLAALFLTFQVANFEAALFLFAGTFTYGIVYTVWLKR